MNEFLWIADEAITRHGAMQKRGELAALLALADGLHPRVVWEIGTATGGTLWALSRVAGAVSYVSIDLPGGPFSGGATVEPDVLRTLVPGVIIARGDSSQIRIDAPRPNLLLIDGDHSYKGVKADWERYGALVKGGGIIAFHDIVPHPDSTGVEVSRLWAEIAASEATVELVDPTDLAVAGNQWGGFGVVFR